MGVESRERKRLKASWLLIAQSPNGSLSLYDSDLNLIEINAAGLDMFPKKTTSTRSSAGT
jgi:hypothetical protein